MSGIPLETASDDRNYHGRAFGETGRWPGYRANGVIILKIGIIGAGKVGTTLGKHLTLYGVPMAGYASRSYESAETAADFTETTAYHTLEELVLASDTLFLTTPDGEIGRVWDCIRETRLELQEKIICHFSGSLSSHVFSGIEQTGAYGCSIHPMFAFNDKFTSYQELPRAVLTLEGHQRAVHDMTNLFGGWLGHRILTIQTEDKVRYHAAATMASNYMIGLFQVSLELLGECGFSQQEGETLLRSLVQTNVENMLEKGVQAALTGPIERNDMGTVKKHLQTLDSAPAIGKDERKDCDGEDGALAWDGGCVNVDRIYRELGQVLVSIAEKKNPNRDYAQLRHLLARQDI